MVLPKFKFSLNFFSPLSYYQTLWLICKNIHPCLIDPKLGYEFLDDNLVAIARLRGAGLKHLQIPQICILTLEHEEEEEEEEQERTDVNNNNINNNNNNNADEDPFPNLALMGILGKVGGDFNAKVRWLEIWK